MIYYYRIDVSEGIKVNKGSKSKECEICHYWYLYRKRFKFQPNACNGFHDLIIMSMNLKYIAIFNIKYADYCCVISGISKSEATNLMKISISPKKAERYKK